MDLHKIMDRHKSTVSNLLKIYDGSEPLHLYLKKYFAANKKHGSKDRKIITELCYSYFRLGQNTLALLEDKNKGAVSLLEVLDIAGYITGSLPLPAALLAGLPEATPVTSESTAPTENTASPLERFKQLQKNYTSLREALLFPFKGPLSTGMDKAALEDSILRQPSLFIRIRPGKGNKEQVLKTLDDFERPYLFLGEHTISLESSTPVSSLLNINKQVVIQDISSQQTGDFLEIALEGLLQKEGKTDRLIKVWDSCAASGGKSLLAYDCIKAAGQKMELTVSDIRGAILINLDKRFREAGIGGYRKQVLDLLSTAPLPFTAYFDLVICDAPCSGSGTWARNPENILFFKEDNITDYYDKQTGIAKKAWEAVRPGGYFLYMTCSVFEKENEAVAAFITQNSGMTLVCQKLITGYKENGDSMFGALYTRKK